MKQFQKYYRMHRRCKKWKSKHDMVLSFFTYLYISGGGDGGSGLSGVMVIVLLVAAVVGMLVTFSTQK